MLAQLLRVLQRANRVSTDQREAGYSQSVLFGAYIKTVGGRLWLEDCVESVVGAVTTIGGLAKVVGGGVSCSSTLRNGGRLAFSVSAAWLSTARGNISKSRNL